MIKNIYEPDNEDVCDFLIDKLANWQIICIFALEQEKTIMAKLNRIRIVLAEHDLNNKWLADKLGKDQATISKWVTNTTQPSLEALIAIANALEVPVQELVRQDEFNQEK